MNSISKLEEKILKSAIISHNRDIQMKCKTTVSKLLTKK